MDAASESLGTRTQDGWEAVIRPRGIGRYFGAAFLSVWLAGWAVGEVVALGFLGHGVAALVRGGPATVPLASAFGLAIGAFLLVWLAIWTFGGVAAIHEFLRLLWGRTRIVIGPDRLIVEEHAGPFRKRREIPRESVQDVRITPSTGTVAVESAAGRVDLVRGARRTERERWAEELRRELKLVDATPGPEALPPDWKEVVTREGRTVVTPDPAVRRKQARVLWILAILGAAIGFAVVFTGRDQPGALAFGLLAAAIDGLFVFGAVRLALGRKEWRVERGRLTLQTRFGDRVRERFEARALELSMRTDSDSDEWFTLRALTEPGQGSGAARDLASMNPKLGPALGLRRELTNGKTILSTMNDASGPRALGRWLAARTGVPLEDRSTPEAQAVDLAELRRRLAESGKLGALASKWIDKLERR